MIVLIYVMVHSVLCGIPRWNRLYFLYPFLGERYEQGGKRVFSTIISGALLGIRAIPVRVEVDAASGLPSINMVGSLGSEVRESRERVCAAMKNEGLEIPPRHITINLSPADLRKDGTSYDLPIAVGMLEALGYLPPGSAQGILFLGELGLNGEIRGARGVLPIVREAAAAGIRECIVPRENQREGGIIPGICVRGAGHLGEVIRFLLADRDERELILPAVTADGEMTDGEAAKSQGIDFSEIRGQEVAVRAAVIAASGFHNLLMVGPPGAGKSMIARRIPGILPPLSLEESLEVTAVYSVAGKLGEQALIRERPFQSPHHTISTRALIGGGNHPRPGMISLAHRGVLFLDELPEFQRVCLDSMRQPLEDRQVQISRVFANLVYPADFMLVCAMNPCPCGYYPDKNRCHCTESRIQKYMGKVSGPILDRIDLCVQLQPVDVVGLQTGRKAENSDEIRERVLRARELQNRRFQGTGYRFNADIEVADMERFCSLGEAQTDCMKKIYKTLRLSARAYHRILKVARTIADLDGAKEIQVEHLKEAACYRPSWEYWI